MFNSILASLKLHIPHCSIIYLFIFNAFGFFHVPTNSPSLHSFKQPKIEKVFVLKIFIKQDFDYNDFILGDIFFHHQEPPKLSPYTTLQRTKKNNTTTPHFEIYRCDRQLFLSKSNRPHHI